LVFIRIRVFNARPPPYGYTTSARRQTFNPKGCFTDSAQGVKPFRTIKYIIRPASLPIGVYLYVFICHGLFLVAVGGWTVGVGMVGVGGWTVGVGMVGVGGWTVGGWTVGVGMVGVGGWTVGGWTVGGGTVGVGGWTVGGGTVGVGGWTVGVGWCSRLYFATRSAQRASIARRSGLRYCPPYPDRLHALILYPLAGFLVGVLVVVGATTRGGETTG
jgi:hypothetical protein